MVTVGEYVERASAVLMGQSCSTGMEPTTRSMKLSTLSLRHWISHLMTQKLILESLPATNVTCWIHEWQTESKSTHRLLIWLVRRGLAACALLRMRAR